MARVIITQEAHDDLLRIYLYISRQSEARAAQVTDEIASAAEILADFPELGRLVPERGPLDLREIFARNYRVIYELVGDEVRVRKIMHSAQRFNLRDFL